MTDNFKIISEKLLQFNSDDDFYVIEIHARKKDNPTGKSDWHIQNYYIKSSEELQLRTEEIKSLCNLYHARAYISVNPKSWEQCTKNMAVVLANKIAANDYSKPQAIFNKVCSIYKPERSRLFWIIDVDKEDDEDDVNSKVNSLINKIETCEPYNRPELIIPTKNGYHIICKPFNLLQFGLDNLVKKNNMTLLYEQL